MSGRIDAGTLLARALIAHAATSGIAVEIIETTATRWASATFAGARHRLTVTGTGGEIFDGWLDALPEADLPLRGHLVADLSIDDRRDGNPHPAATIEVLTVEEA